MANPIVSSLTFSDLIDPGNRMFKPPRNMCPTKPLSFREKMSVRALLRRIALHLRYIQTQGEDERPCVVEAVWLLCGFEMHSCLSLQEGVPKLRIFGFIGKGHPLSVWKNICVSKKRGDPSVLSRLLGHLLFH